MIDLGRLVDFLNTYLKVEDFDEGAINGLQVEGSTQVRRVAFAVDGVMDTFQRATAWDADLLIVHHGIYWGRQWALRGPDYQRVKLLVDGSCGLYAVHLPLDAHPVLGHAAVLLKGLGARPENLEPFGQIGTQSLGMRARLSPVSRQELTKRLETVLGGPVNVLPFGAEDIQDVACVTGQGAGFDLLGQVVGQRIDCYITGEGTHPVYHYTKEHGINLVLGGHYRTETLGMRALEELVASEFDVETTFFDVPTPF